MSHLTRLALGSRSVTILIILLVLSGGVFTYRSLQVELFPQIEFPLVTISAFYPSANPEAVVSDVTEPIENAISGVEGIEEIQSISSENLSLVLANFTFSIDMAEAERTIQSRIGSVSFPSGVEEPTVGRINVESFPVLQLSILADREIADLQAIVESLVLPAITQVNGVFSADLSGGVDPQVLVTVDPDRLAAAGISLFQISQALEENNITFPAGTITEDGQTYPIRTTHSYNSLDEIRDLVVGFPGAQIGGVSPGGGQGTPPGGGADDARPVLLSDVADVTIGAGPATSVSRTNGKPSLGVSVLKEPDANTVDVTGTVMENLDALDLPEDIRIATIINDGPDIQAQIDTLQREALLGFLFAVLVVFAFLLTRRPSLAKGLQLTLRPTVVIGLSIPLSIFTGILLMGFQGMTLNFMTLGGLAISVGRVVDDSIVVLENVYRRIQRDEDRVRAALEATREVAPAITSSTLTTIVVFVPLAFLQGLVGSFFTPFALTVTYALIASLLVALTAVPVLGAILLRRGDMISQVDSEEALAETESWMQRVYAPVLKWSLGHKLVTLVVAVLLTAGSVGLMAFIPVTLFGSGGARFLSINMTLPPGSSIESTLSEVDQVEGVLERLSTGGVVDLYQTTIGNPESGFIPGAGPGVGGSSRASVFVRLEDDAPEDIIDDLRNDLEGREGRTIAITEISDGPPVSGLEVAVTGHDYDAISDVARVLAAEFSAIDGIVDVTSDVSEGRDEIVVEVKLAEAARLGLSARTVAFQVNQFMVGRPVTVVDLDGSSTTVVLKGSSEDVDNIEKVKAIAIAGPLGTARLGEVADVVVREGPLSVSRIDGRRAASITGVITGDDAQAIGLVVQQKIDAMTLPGGVQVKTGGIFAQIAEGFEDIFLAMGIGILLVYLVMAASLGALRNPFVIVMSLPLAVIGALTALAITGRTLGLPAMMGMLLLVGIVVTNAIVLIAFVEQLRERGLSIPEALVQGAKVRLRPILMTAFTTSFALLPLAAFVEADGGIIGAELATVVIGGLMSSTFLTLIVVPVVYTIMHDSIPSLFARLGSRMRRSSGPVAETA